ncbi:MAG: ABC transporter permease [Oscillospiraceae bacterium]|nr:ABC transporter permease [Oscillospiraceae bacterium]
MKKYFAIGRILFKAQSAYRFDVLMTATGMIWRIVFAWILWGAIFTGREMVGGFTHSAMLSYYVVSSFFATMEMSYGVVGEVSARIKGGTFSKFMVIPSNPQLHFLSQTVGASVYYGLFAALAAVAGTLAFRIDMIFTGNLFNVFLALATFLLGTVFMNSFQFFMGLWAFKYHDTIFLTHVPAMIISFFTGELVPLSLLPGGIAGALRYFPFTHVVYTPTMLLTGGMEAREGAIGLVALAAWAAVMATISQFAYGKLRKKYEGVGI